MLDFLGRRHLAKKLFGLKMALNPRSSEKLQYEGREVIGAQCWECLRSVQCSSSYLHKHARRELSVGWDDRRVSVLSDIASLEVGLRDSLQFVKLGDKGCGCKQGLGETKLEILFNCRSWNGGQQATGWSRCLRRESSGVSEAAVRWEGGCAASNWAAAE